MKIREASLNKRGQDTKYMQEIKNKINSLTSTRQEKSDNKIISDLNETIVITQEDKLCKEEKYNEYKLLKMLEELNETREEVRGKFDDKRKCIMIAIRIINGDNVPIKDMVFLKEKEPEMYLNAILLRRRNKKPKKYKSLIEDEDTKTCRNPIKINESVEIIVKEDREIDIKL